MKNQSPASNAVLTVLATAVVYNLQSVRAQNATAL